MLTPPNLLRPLRLCFAATCLTLLLPPPWAVAAEEEPEEEPAPVGFQLGEFLLRDYQPLQDVTTKMIFTVHASVEAENAELFATRLETRRNRVKDQVLIAARLAEPEELQDPELVLLRRRILLRLRHSLPELPIDKIYLSEFQLFTD